uniref:Uncharacterized protein n=1 Tax=Setaria viridis TaxID=4556 RepID=A0A4U6U2T2_SETVI|nr:hypothetical protein SEVIR_6G127554v2 [Setaria viridis]
MFTLSILLNMELMVCSSAFSTTPPGSHTYYLPSP